MKRYYVTFNNTIPALFDLDDYFHSASNLMKDEIGYVMNTSFNKVIVYIKAKININDQDESAFYLSSSTELIYNTNEIDDYLNGALESLKENYSNVVNSGYLLSNVEYFDITVSYVSSMFGSSYIKLPFRSRCLINIKNEDNKCFLWCILAKIHYDEIKEHRSRVSKYKNFEDEINMKNISYPFKVKDLKKFHKLNPDISVTIYYLSDPEDLKSIVALERNNLKRKHMIDLLLVSSDTNSHYILITSINSIISKTKHKSFLCTNCQIYAASSQEALNNHKIKCRPIDPNNQNIIIEETLDKNNNPIFICNNCLNKSYKFEHQLENHQLQCLKNKSSKIVLPTKYNNILKFDKFNYESEIPFRIYMDFEAINIRESENNFNQKPCCYSIVLISDFQNLISNKTITYSGTSYDDTIYNFINEIKSLQSELFEILRTEKKMNLLNDEEKRRVENTYNCDWCKVEFSNKYYCLNCKEEQDKSKICTRHLFYRNEECKKCIDMIKCHKRIKVVEDDENNKT